MIRLPSMSKVGLSLACQFHLSPHAPKVPFEPMSAAADHGIEVHAIGEAVIEGRVVLSSEKAAPYQRPIEGAIAALRAEGWTLEAEVPVAYSPSTGTARLLRKGAHRAYGDVKATEIPGTADVVGRRDNAVLVADWKTGRGARLVDAVETAQLRALALAFARAYAVDQVEVALLHVEPGECTVDRGELFAWDLEETADQLRALAATVDHTPKPGPHCTGMWCPIRAVCPATVAALQRINAAAAKAFPDAMLVVDSDDKARAARVALKLYDEAAETLKTSLHDYVRRNGAIDLGDGTRYALTVQERERVEVDAEILDLLRQHDALDAVDYRTSKEALKRAIAAKHPGRGVAVKRLRALLDDLRTAGKVSTSSFERFDTIKSQTDNSNDDEENAA